MALVGERCVTMLRACLLGMALAGGSPALAQDGATCANILHNGLALPQDMALNMAPVGEVFVVAHDGCAEPVYAIQFPHQLAEAEAGNVVAMDLVGLMYAAGAGTDQNWRQARRWLERAAQGGSAPAHYRLALMDQHGLDGRPDVERAVAHLRLASAAGLAWASTNLGQMHFAGDGVRQDLAEAVRLFELGRQQGDPAATQNLASIYAQGLLGGTPDFARAVPLAREAAGQGDVGGMRMLAFFHANGSGVERDFPLAYLWASLAAERGDGPAAQIKRLVGERLGSATLAGLDARLADCTLNPRPLCAGEP